MTNPSDEKKQRRWPRRLLIGAVVAPALMAVVGFFVVPPVVKHLTVTQLGELLGRRVHVGHVSANPFSLSLTVNDFQVFEPDGRTLFAGFQRLYVNAQWQSLYRRAPVVREVRLESPRVHVVRLKATAEGWGDPAAYNFSDIISRFASSPPAPKPALPPDEAPARFSLNNIRVTDGELHFDDRPLRSKHKVSSLELGVPFVSTLPTFVDTFVQPGLRVSINGTPFELAGRTKPFKDSLETTVELRATALDLTRYLPYVPVPLRFQVASALLDLNVDLSFVRPSTESGQLTAKGRLALNKVALREEGGSPLLALHRFEMVVGKADLMASNFNVARVTVAGLEVHARRLPNGTLNLERLAPAAPPPTRAAKAEKVATPHFTVRELSFEEVAFHLRDETVRPPFTVDVDQVVLSARGISNAPGARATLTVGMRAVPGGTLKHEGSFTLTPLAATGTLSIDGLEPARFAPYYRDQIALDVRQGRVRLGATYAVSGLGSPVAPAAGPRVKGSTASPPGQSNAGHFDFQISNGFVELAELALRRRDARADFLNVGDLAVRGVRVEPKARTIEVGQLATHGGRFQAERNERGTLDVSTLFAPEAPGPTAASPSATSAARRSSSAAPRPPGDGAVTAVSSAKEAAWTFNLARLEVDGWSARFEDRAIRPKASLSVSPIRVEASDIGTRPGSRGTLDLRLGINKTGRLAVTGTAGLEPVSADLRIDLRTLEFLPLQPYFAQQVNLTVTDGTLSAKGRAKVEVPKGSPARITFGGDIDVANFASLDGDKHEEFLKWKSFHVGGLAVTSAPLSLAIRDVALTDFYSRLVIFPDAHFNVQEIFGPPSGQAGAAPVRAAAPPAKSPGTTGRSPVPVRAGAREARDKPIPITIGQVTLQGGQVSFSDRLIRPNYSAELTELAGRVSGLSADGATQADVDIRGSVGHSGTLSIVGKVNPLAGDLFVDLKVDLKEFELPPTSPYAGRYAGYGISKGKLALALDYHVANRKLDAKNRLVVEQFTFGDKVNSPEATKLPVRLAVAILKDRKGVIDINLPIAGSLDNPDFKIGRAVLKVLGNLVVKAATAPFSMIASLFGGEDELSHVTFGHGTFALDARARQRMSSLATALRERPGLSFEIAGAADPVRDREGLKQHLYHRTIRAQKILELVQSGAPVPDPEVVTFAAAERPRLVGKAYQAGTFPKPRNALGRPKDLPAPEMEKLLVANTVVDDDALRGLAERRAGAVREFLAKLAPDAAARLFLVASRLSKPAEGSGHRVDFKLKKD